MVSVQGMMMPDDVSELMFVILNMFKFYKKHLIQAHLCHYQTI